MAELNLQLRAWYANKHAVIDDKMAILDDGISTRISKKLNMKYLTKFELELQRMQIPCPYRFGQRDYYEKLEHAEIPYLAWIVYSLLITKERFPTMEEVIAAYLNTYCKKIGYDTYKFKDEFHVDGDFEFHEFDIRNRVYRAYFSFVREYHILLNLQSYDDMKATYNFDLDIQGTDIQVECNNQKFYIRSYLETKRSRRFKIIKEKVKHEYGDKEKKVIEVPAIIYGYYQNTVDYGDIKLHSCKDIQQLHDYIVQESYNIGSAEEKTA